jgi:hypothetical protein
MTEIQNFYLVLNGTAVEEVMVIPEVAANSSWNQRDQNVPISINLAFTKYLFFY